MNLEEYLKINYDTVKKLDNGNYKFITYDGTEVYVPSNFGKETKLCGYMTGKDGVEAEAQKIRDKMEGSNPPNCVTVISPKSNDTNNMLNIGSQVIKDNNSKVSSIYVDTFGTGNTESIVNLDEWLKNHPDLSKVSTIILKAGDIDAFKGAGLSVDNGTNIIVVGETEEAVKAGLKDLTDAGYNAKGTISEKSNTNNIVDKLVSNDDKDKTTYYTYDPKTGEYNKIGGESEEKPDDSKDKTDDNKDDKDDKKEKPDDSKEEKKKDDKKDEDKKDDKSPSGGGGGGGKDKTETKIDPEKIDPKSYTKADKFQIKEENISAVSKYKHLKEVNDFKITFPEGRTYSEATISSTNFVSTNMNALRKNIKGTSFLSGLKIQKYRSGSGIPGIISANIDRYFNSVGNMIDKINQEAVAAVSIAQSWLYLDDKQAEEARKLGSSPYIVPIDTQTATATGADIVAGDAKNFMDPNIVYNPDPEIDAKIKAILADPTIPNDPNSQAYPDGVYTPLEVTMANFKKLEDHRNSMCIIDCDTGDIYYRDSEIHIKNGETKKFIVKLPTDTGKVIDLCRTTADNCGHGDLLNTYCDIDPDPNAIDTIDICHKKANGKPLRPAKDVEHTKTDHYIWVIEPKKAGEATISQTCQYRTDVSTISSKKRTWKVMLKAKFVIDK